MPNTPICHAENCYMPPKKSAWRFENLKFPAHSPSESEKINYHNMGLMSENEMKPVEHIQFYPSEETFSHKRNEQFEEAPLDFSIKKDINRRPESNSHSVKPINYDLKEDNRANPPPVRIVYPIGNSPPFDNPTNLETSLASSSKDSDSFDMDYSQESVKSPSRSVDSCINRVNEICRINSADHVNVSRENSPVSQPSILEEMLKNRQQSNNVLPNGPQAFETGFKNGIGMLENQIITSHSPPMAMNGSVMHPTNMLPLTMAPYFGYGYVEHPNPFMNGYMYKPLEPNMVDVSTARKTRKKLDPLTDSLKAYSIDELRHKLNSLSGGRSLINPDYQLNSKSCHIPQRRHFTNNASSSPETVTSSNNGLPDSLIMKSENCEKDKAVESISQTNNTNNVNHTKETDRITVDIKLNENSSQNTVNHNEMNVSSNTAIISYIEEPSDSMQSAITESSPDGRKRKPFEDYKNDPQYRLKRAKNNAAARRSRESRRIKEELIRQTATVLEQQNKVIVHENTTLRYGMEEANLKYLALMKEYESLKIHNSVLNERLNQKRCGQCGTAFPNVN